jgi:hypothetical protein
MISGNESRPSPPEAIVLLSRTRSALEVSRPLRKAILRLSRIITAEARAISRRGQRRRKNTLIAHIG